VCVQHAFPLPYHNAAFYTAQGLFVIQKYNASSWFDYATLIFTNQNLFGTSVSLKTTGQDMIQLIANTVEKAGILSAKTFVAGMSDDTLNTNARIQWKYGCQHSISGTPMYNVNGVYSDGGYFIDILFIYFQSDDLASWSNIIDPLLKN